MKDNLRFGLVWAGLGWLDSLEFINLSYFLQLVYFEKNLV